MRAARFSDYEEVLFHIGLHKTGTSYLQSMLRANARKLRGAGIHYPEYRDSKLAVLRDGNHSSAVVKAAPDLPMAEALDQHLALSASCPTLLLSAEQFCQTASVDRLANEAELLQRQRAPRFIAYFRRYDELTESVYSQVVKDWATGDISPGYYRTGEGLFRRIAPILAAYGAQALTIRPYNRRLWVDGSLGADYFSALGLAETWPLMTRRRHATKNASLSRSQTWLLSRVAARKTKRRLVAYFADHPLPVPDESSRFFLSPAKRRALNRAGLAADAEMFAAMGICDPVDFLDLECFPDEQSWTPFEPDRKVLDPYLAEFLANQGP